MAEDGSELTVKLTREEREIAELLPWVRTASHVGRYGWITATIGDDDALEAALEWLRESYWLKAPAGVRDAAFADA
jgi:predicted DNA-binding protein (MmcQ/YjbR family)